MARPIAALFAHPPPLFLAAGLLRVVMLIYGLWQDANSPLKYTDIDYMVFTDAARFTFPQHSPAGPFSSSPSNSPSSLSPPASPYTRETYRYTPLLAWMLWPTTLPGVFCFSSGKVLFAAADLLAGWLLLVLLREHARMPTAAALRYAAIWLLNPMVATISTRGSSEGLLGVLVTALLWAVLVVRHPSLAGLFLGLGVHFKIYPFIYAPAIVWWMDDEHLALGPASPSTHTDPAPRKEGDGKSDKDKVKGRDQHDDAGFAAKLLRFPNSARLRLAAVSLLTFLGLNAAMYALYGEPFVVHTFLHHVSRVDHRHNFSPYNVLLYLVSAEPRAAGASASIGIESLAFLPQLLLSTILIPLVGAKKDLPTTMLAQTFAFVTFNKVCTSQVCPSPPNYHQQHLSLLFTSSSIHITPRSKSSTDKRKCHILINGD